MNVLILFVHGTWGRSWSLAKNSLFKEKLRRALSAAGVEQERFIPFPWNGKNSVSARQEAAIGLARVVKLGASRPDVDKVVLIAHSHGGNVALQALIDSRVRKPVGLFCIATPFIFTTLRRWEEYRMLSCLGISSLIAWIVSYPSNWHHLLVFALILVVTTAIIVGLEKLARTYAERIVCNIRVPSATNMKNVVMHVYRTMHDEATAALASSQMLRILMRRLVSFIGRVLGFCSHLLTPIAVGWFLLTFVFPSKLEAGILHEYSAICLNFLTSGFGERGAKFLFSLLPYLLAYMVLATTGVLAALLIGLIAMISGLAYGLDAGICSLYYEMGVVDAAPGNTTLRVIDSSDLGAGLEHSAIYESPLFIKAVVGDIVEFCEPGALSRKSVVVAADYEPPRGPFIEVAQTKENRDYILGIAETIRMNHEHQRKRLIAKYGPDSEKFSLKHLELLEQEPGVSREEVQAESAREPVCSAESVDNWSELRELPPHVPRPELSELPPHLPRLERILACASKQIVCDGCGKQMGLIGYEETEQLDVESTNYFVLVTKREVRGCCERQGLVSAPLPPRIIQRSLVSDRIVMDITLSKYCDRVPIYRQSATLESCAGLKTSRHMLGGWVLEVGESLIPMVSAMRQELIKGTYIQVHRTTVRVHEFAHRDSEGFLWRYSTPGGMVVYDFRSGQERYGPKKFLGQFEGVLQTDGHRVYDQIKSRRVVQAGCWLQVERYFADALKSDPTDPAGISLVARIGELFAIEAKSRSEGLNLTARHALRQQQSRTLLGEIRRQAEAARTSTPNDRSLAMACDYMLTRWERLTRFLEYPELELNNDFAEKPLQVSTRGCESWIHLGSLETGRKVAAILSVVESCRRLEVPLRDYLAAVLPGLVDCRIEHLRNLTPTAWATLRR